MHEHNAPSRLLVKKTTTKIDLMVENICIAKSDWIIFVVFLIVYI